MKSSFNGEPKATTFPDLHESRHADASGLSLNESVLTVAV